MQFAKPEIDGLDDEMDKLKSAIVKGGPYEFVKIAHHGSYNALDADVMGALTKDTHQYAISGGIEDPGHPDPSVLQLLKKKKVHWAHTDRNGLISVTLGAGAEPSVTISRGKENDPTPNAGDVSGLEETKKPIEKRELPPVKPPAVTPQKVTPVTPVPFRGPATDSVEVITKVPHLRTTVSVMIDVIPGGHDGTSVQRSEITTSSGIGKPPERGEPPAIATSDSALGSGRTLPQLLFVTSRKGLTRNIGQVEAERALGMITDAGQILFDGLPADMETAQEALPAVRQQLAAHPDVQGVVLLGGYDVIPAQVLDALDPQLRAAVQGKISDADDFIVWTDAPYGETDGRIVPVSRIADGKSPDLVLAALTADRPSGNPVPLDRFGVRNSARPFAEEIYSLLPARESCWSRGRRWRRRSAQRT